MHVNISPSNCSKVWFLWILITKSWSFCRIRCTTVIARQCESPYAKKAQPWLIWCYNKWLILKPVSYFPHKCTTYEPFPTCGAHSLAHAIVDFHMLTLTLHCIHFHRKECDCDTKATFTDLTLNPQRDYSAIVYRSTINHKRGICWNINTRTLAYVVLRQIYLVII